MTVRLRSFACCLALLWAASALPGCQNILGIDAVPVLEPRCTDGRKNGRETDVDCGGSACGACADGGHCEEAGDCRSGVCTDNMCQPVRCGDATVNGVEVCDPGSSQTATCDRDCTLPACGDGLPNALAGEDCDPATGDADGDSLADAPTADCNLDCTAAFCGDRLVNPAAGEQCDGSDDSIVCDLDCTLPACGDGLPNALAGEDCDPATGDADGDGDADAPTPDCDFDCTLPACGDRVINPAAGEQCDGNHDSIVCDLDCTLPACGDGLVNALAGEQCDPATGDTDGDGLADGPTADCDINCTTPACGDGLVNQLAEEECDPATGDADGDGLADMPSADCDIDCTAAFCGDGLVNPAAGEECDSGNPGDQENTLIVADEPSCSDACLLLCGNGLLDGEEEVDPPPGPSTTAPLDELTCRYDFSAITQLSCNGTCGVWGGGNGCQQEDADALCRLKTGDPTSTALSYDVVSALPAPGICCTPMVAPYPQFFGCVSLGILPGRNVGPEVLVNDTNLRATHGSGNVVTNVVCTEAP